MYKEFNHHLSKALQGNPEGKEEITTRLKPLILASIRRYYYKKDILEDLVQEGYLVVLESLANYDESKKVQFLAYIKLNLKYHYLNKHKEKHHLSLNQNLGETEEEWQDHLESPEEDQLTGIIRKETSIELEKALATLTEKQRQTILSYYIERKPIQEIANQQGVTYRTIVNTKTRALEKLRTIVKQS